MNLNAAFHRSARRRPRSGWSLVECVVAITVSAVILNVATQLLVTTYAQQRRVESTSVTNRSVNRLFADFRREVRSATAAITPDAEPKQKAKPEVKPGKAVKLLTLQLANDRKINYARTAVGIVCTWQKSGQQERKEYYLLPSNTAATVTLSGSAPSVLCTLTVAPCDATGQVTTAARRSLVAAVAADAEAAP